MRTTLVGFALLMALPNAGAVPAPASGREAKQKLEALKKRLPDIVAAWAKEQWSEEIEVRVVRLVGPTQAKVSLLSAYKDGEGRRRPRRDVVFTIFLDYYDGAWTTTRYEALWVGTKDDRDRALQLLMLAIDEATEK
jgi:hypothetical protein